MREPVWMIAMACILWGSGGCVVRADEPTQSIRFPAVVTRYDLTTRQELLYTHWLTPLVMSDDATHWKWIAELVNEVGTWSGAFIDAPKISEAINHGMAIDGQAPLAKVDLLVMSCAKTLGVTKPKIVVKNSPEPSAYMVATDKETFLVINSRLLELFDGADDELRFVVGRELGRIKCEHLKIRRAAYGLMTVLQGVNTSVAPAAAQKVLPSLVAGRLMTWSRESEISADRAGLVCCGSLKIAVAALSRQLHGLPKHNQYLDPNKPDFDADKIISQFRRWENEPFLTLVTYLHEQDRSAPYIPERLAELTKYAQSREYEALFRRQETEGAQLAIIDGIEVLGLASPPGGVYPYVRCCLGSKSLFYTPTGVKATGANWQGINQIVSESPGQPIFFEIYDQGYVSNTLLGGFVVYPTDAGSGVPGVQTDPGETTYHTNILWSWNARSSVARAGVARVRVRFAKSEASPR